MKLPIPRTSPHTTPRTIPGGLPALVFRTLIRTLQLICALSITGIYGRDLHHATQLHAHADSRWVYAVIVGGLSIVASIVLALPMVKSRLFFAVDGVLFFLWMVLFAVFGRLYIGEDCEGIGACERMKTGVWFELVGMLCWLMSFVGGAYMFWRECHNRSIHTGRGTV